MGGGDDVKIRILVAVDRDGMTAATQIYDGDRGMRIAPVFDAATFLRREYDIDIDSMQYRIVEADVPGWQEPAVPVVQGEVREVTT
jgi:hypothetical protein